MSIMSDESLDIRVVPYLSMERDGRFTAQLNPRGRDRRPTHNEEISRGEAPISITGSSHGDHEELVKILAKQLDMNGYVAGVQTKSPVTSLSFDIDPVSRVTPVLYTDLGSARSHGFKLAESLDDVTEEKELERLKRGFGVDLARRGPGNLRYPIETLVPDIEGLDERWHRVETPNDIAQYRRALSQIVSANRLGLERGSPEEIKLVDYQKRGDFALKRMEILARKVEQQKRRVA